MLNFEKMCEIKQIMESKFSKDDLIASVFQDFPDLNWFAFSCTSEYDDNNYSDYTRLTSVNGHAVDYDGEYEDGEEVMESDEPKVDRIVTATLYDLVGMIGTDFGHGDDIEIRRENYATRTKKKGKKTKEEKAQSEYLESYLQDKKLDDEWFLKNNIRFAAYYAQDHGPFKPELEMKIFGKVGNMREAFMYAQAIQKPLSEGLEQFFVTHGVLGSEDDGDRIYLKKYLVLKESFSGASK